MALSPRTNAFMQPPPSGEDAQAAFDQGFSQMATSIMLNKFPELSQNIVTFKTIKTDMEQGSGIGAFVLDLNGEQLFVPVVLASNQIKPIQMIYFKDRNIFVPLKREWIDEIGRHADESMGRAVKEPKNLQRDVDIRNLVIPPTTGRYAYASDGEFHPGAKGAIDGSGRALANFLTKAPNFTKKAFARVLERNRKLLKFASEHFDLQEILSALQPHQTKTAAAGTVEFLTTQSSVDEFRKVFGKKAAEAFEIATKLGYVLKDSRPQQNLVVETERPIRLFETKESGFYNLYKRDGSRVSALVVAQPMHMDAQHKFDKRRDIYSKPSTYARLHKRRSSNVVPGGTDEMTDYDSDQCSYPEQYLVVTAEGDCEVMDVAPFGEKLDSREATGKLLKVINAESDSVSPNSSVVFLGFKGDKLVGTVPVSVTSVGTDSKDVRRIETGYATLVTDPKSPSKVITAPHGSSVVSIPRSYIAIQVKRGELPLQLACDVTTNHIDKLVKEGALRVSVISDNDGGLYSINGDVSYTKVGCVRELVTRYSISAEEAENVMEKAAERRTYRFLVATPAQMRKYAEGVPVDPNTGAPMGMAPEGDPNAQVDPNTGMPMDPSMQGAPVDPNTGMPMDPSMMAPPPMAPPPPSPVDLAVLDVGTQYAQQAAATAQQLADVQKQLADRMSVLQEVKSRADQISVQNPGMPPTATSGMGDMLMPQEMPMEEEMPMDPMAEEQAAAGMANNIEGPMTDAVDMAQAIPGGQENLPGPEVVESTAISAMATNPDLRGIVAAYVPNLEEALDNLARILLTLWMQEAEFTSALGDAEYADLEERLRLVFDNLGALILKVNQTAMAATERDEQQV